MQIEHLFDRFYYSRPNFLGGTRAFHNICRKHAPLNGRILEIGAGPTNDTSALLSGLGTLSGVDISKDVLGNRHLQDAKVFDGHILPYEDNSFDFCVSDWVLEHVEYPDEHFREVARVLKPGGLYCFRTMNLWHYVSLPSRLLPYSLHLFLSARLRSMPEDAHDPYPTFYRANTRRRVLMLADRANLVVDDLSLMEPEPSYGRGHALLFFPMMAYERIVNCSSLLSFLRVTLLATLQKRK